MAFIQSQHPNKSIAPTADQVRSFLKLGWIGQAKMNGHRLQIHISPKGKLFCYTRHGSPHTKNLTTELEASFLQYVDPDGMLVLEGEWMKSLNQVFLFDVLRFKGDTLIFSTYKERYKILKSIFSISPNIKIIKTLNKESECMKVLQGDDETVEGLVMKAWDTKGWPDTAIVRCLKPKG